MKAYKVEKYITSDEYSIIYNNLIDKDYLKNLDKEKEKVKKNQGKPKTKMKKKKK